MHSLADGRGSYRYLDKMEWEIMPKIVSVGICKPPYSMTQEAVVAFAKEMFSGAFSDIQRLLQVFQNGQIETRNFAKDLSWFRREHTWEEKNHAYIECATLFGVKAIQTCLQNDAFLQRRVEENEVDAFFFISSTGLSTPTIDVKIMNRLSFSPHTKRIPIWGLGCAGGASGLARALEYCKAFPRAKVIVLAVELCSLTFQRHDVSKSNLIGTSLFADGAACILVAGEEADICSVSLLPALPAYLDAQSTLLKDSEDVMGWDVKNEGLYVVFSKHIPTLIKTWLRPNIEPFVRKHGLTLSDITHFIAHPGGKKVLEAYQEALDMPSQKTETSLNVLKENGNMSSVTVFYVLERYMRRVRQTGEIGMIAALGPGFSSELVLVRWEDI